jgi:tetratricopeptide (TPR) repeat protein
MSKSRLVKAIEATRQEDYLQGLTLFLDLYGSDEAPPIENANTAAGLSFFGLCVALVQRKFKPAIDLCNRAISLQFYNGDHYENLARVFVAAGKRKKAIDTVEQGLKISPEHDGLLKFRRELGVRARPPVPFLDRSHPINVTLGQARHAKKVTSTPRKKK